MIWFYAMNIYRSNMNLILNTLAAKAEAKNFIACQEKV